jgi:hypothetical protein
MNLALRAETNMFRAAKAWAAASGGRISDSPALLSTTSPAALRSFNQMFVKSTALDGNELAQTVDVYRRENPRFRLRVRADVEKNSSP